MPVRPLLGVPLNKADVWQKSIFERCKRIRPEYSPIVGIEEFEGKTFIVIWCPGGGVRPYSSPKTMGKNEKERVYYIRKSSMSVQPTEDEKKDLFSLANRVPYDDQVNNSAELSDINYTLVKEYLQFRYCIGVQR